MENQFDLAWDRVLTLTSWNQKSQLADYLSIKRQSVSSARRRGNFPLDWAYKIATDFDSSVEWILEGRGPKRLAEEIEKTSSRQLEREVGKKTPDLHPAPFNTYSDVSIPRWSDPDPEMFDYIPMAEAQLSAGGGCFVISENMEEYYAFRKNWLSRVATSPENLVLMRIHGNSMAPTLEDNDTAMIDIGRRDIKEGMIYALRVDHSVMIKRLSFRVGGKVLIISDNRTEYDPYEAEMKDLHVIGQVIFFCRTFVSE